MEALENCEAVGESIANALWCYTDIPKLLQYLQKTSSDAFLILLNIFLSSIIFDALIINSFEETKRCEGEICIALREHIKLY